MLVMILFIIVGAVFFRWLYENSFSMIIGAFTGLLIGLLFSIGIGPAVVPTTTTKIEEYNIAKYYINDDKLYYEREDGVIGSIDIDSKTIRTGNKTYIEKRYYKVNKNMNFIIFCVDRAEETFYLKGAD